MSLHCHFAQAKLRADLLVDEPGDYQVHHLPFSRRELLNARLQDGYLSLLVPTDAIPIKPVTNRCQKVFFLERLHQKLDGSCLHRARGHGDIAVCSNKDDGNRHISFHDLLLPFHPPVSATPYSTHQTTRTA